MNGSDVPILVCDCGKRLRAPGATPGRVGRCPACGDLLRVPSSTPSEMKEEKKEDKEKRKKRKKRHEAAIWDGFVQAPRQCENQLRESLLYPLWGTSGITLLVFFPPLLWLTSFPWASSLVALSGSQSAAGLGVFFLLLPSGTAFLMVFGYALLYLGRVAASSAQGEVYPPRWPEWDIGSIVSGLGRWAWAALVGVAVGGVPATAYWISCGDIDLFDTLIMAELAALGAVYALMALMASILHEDLLAANPWTVAAAIWRSGWGYARPCLVAGFAALGAFTLGAAALQIENPPLAAFVFGLFWVVALYEAMVVLRVLGLFYRQHARDLGCFRDRTGWGV